MNKAKKSLAQPSISPITFNALNYLRYLPDQVIRDRYLDLKTVEQGNGKIMMEAMRRHTRLTNNWQQALLIDAKELQKIYAANEQALYRPCAEASLARRAMAAIIYQDIYPEFYRFQEQFDSFEEFWCAVEWDLMYRAMRGSGLINVTEEVKPQGKRKWAEQGNEFFKYLEDSEKVPFKKQPELIDLPAAEALHIYAIYHAQQDEGFRRRQLAEFAATLKRCHREIRNNKLQLGYLLEDGSLIIFEKHGKQVLKPDT